jgi:Domain of unknown function (DUF4384)
MMRERITSMPMRRRLAGYALAAVCAATLPFAAAAQDNPAQSGQGAAEEENTRAVRIIEDQPPKAPAAVEPEAPAAVARPTLPTVEIGKAKAANPAGVSVELLPGTELRAGSKLSFKITTKRSGYLILVDVDASGKLTQIYPNRNSLLMPGGREASNYIKAGRTVTVPDRNNPWAGFEFIASPPNGVAMVVAILSDRPVQIIDLPDVPGQVAGQTAALEYLADFARSLRIPGSETGTLREAKWSFDAKFYQIR